MKKIFISLLVLSLVFWHTQTSRAQDAVNTTAQIEQAEGDYRFQFDQYRLAHDLYVTAKAEYLKSGNLKTQQDALLAAKKTAVARGDVLKTYTRWINLQLIAYQTPFPQVVDSITALNNQINWYNDEQAKIQTAQTQDSFELVMADYVKTQIDRDKLYARAEIDLKLAQTAFFQQQARALYDPLLAILQTKTTIPEVSQGMAKVAELGGVINQEILDTKTKSGAIESGDLGVFQALRQTSEKLESLRTKQLELINIMMELESRYGQ